MPKHYLSEIFKHIWEAEICLSEISGIATYLGYEKAGRRVKNMVSFIP
jgi:hypothetical protein